MRGNTVALCSSAGSLFVNFLFASFSFISVSLSTCVSIDLLRRALSLAEYLQPHGRVDVGGLAERTEHRKC